MNAKRHLMLASPLLSLALLAFAVTTASAQIDQITCEDPQTQMEMNVCADREFQAADKALNEAWPPAYKAMKERDTYLANQPEHMRRDAAQALLDAQRGWIAYRDGQCKAEASGSAGGSIEPLLYSSCLAALTHQRTKELKKMVETR